MTVAGQRELGFLLSFPKSTTEMHCNLVYSSMVVKL